MTDKDLALALRLADLAGAAIRPLFRGQWSEEKKADRSFVTEADRAAEAAMRRLIEAEFSADGIIGEEYGTRNEGAGRQWVLDPIDGTTSFIAGRPIFGTLIALLQDGWPVLGIIDQPIAGERWVGRIGQPTLFNGKPAQARPLKDLSDAVLATTSPHLFTNEEADAFMSVAKQVAEKKIVFGGDCYNYGLVASGHVDVVIEAGLKLYDYAALVPVVEGAGGMMADWQGNPLDAGSDGTVVALGDPARLEDVLEAMG
ncbi:histidinol phosphatase-like enzyme (inositol monophosphatase family) [Erythromicrobium ramosum]|uniref:Histidinol-phosphatase n=1 Tax=Erythrobacter ramosus TaxID=35811 RepID=A0A6I4UJF2_9SPHN|nr:histidinol-phosphatase [Erythrobacter ramosus]MBB3774402.1 histidinol phosphatase-like enzyme (inositol monophosphatase family) [Erythrobacter ramosus]MXP37944.1 histidinol-phosphatase [Erythrobacter ramosus]